MALEKIIKQFRLWLDLPRDTQERQIAQQPFINEFYLAEDDALEKIFTGVNDPLVNAAIDKSTNRLFEYYKNKWGRRFTEVDLRQLALRNARRVIWEAPLTTEQSTEIFDFQYELSSQKARLMQQKLSELGVWEEFQQLYPDGILSSGPDRPYW